VKIVLKIAKSPTFHTLWLAQTLGMKTHLRPQCIPEYLYHFTTEWIGVTYPLAGFKSPTFHLIAIGSPTEVHLSPRDLFMHLLLHEVREFDLIHFHPSGNDLPSSADLQTTRRALRVGRVLGIRLNSLWIITPKQNRVLPKLELCRRTHNSPTQPRPKAILAPQTTRRTSRLRSALIALKLAPTASVPKFDPSPIESKSSSSNTPKNPTKN